MKRRRSLVGRVLVVAMASGLVGSAGALLIADRVGRAAFADRLESLIVGRFGPRYAGRCEWAPQSWSVSFPEGWSVRGYAYDATTGRSRNPEAPPLRAELLARLPPGPKASAIDLGSWPQGGGIIIRTGAAPPCDLVQLLWHNPPIPVRLTTTLVGGGVASAFLAFALGIVALVLPLVRRIRRLRTAAERVGQPGGYKALRGEDDGDELHAIGGILDKAHARIRADALLLEEQRNALERHLADVAHDMRTPLTSLQVALEYAADSSGQPAQRAVLTAALRDVVYLAALTSNLRLASRLRMGWDPTQEVTDVDLAEIVARIAARARLLARRRDLELDASVPDAPVVVTCNAVAVEQAISNVVDNAVAYGDPGGHVAVLLAASERGDSFSLEVRDDGPGVPPQELPRLGQRTFRSDEARQRDPSGTGLGLAITGEVCTRFAWALSFAGLQPRGLLVTIRGTAKICG